MMLSSISEMEEKELKILDRTCANLATDRKKQIEDELFAAERTAAIESHLGDGAVNAVVKKILVLDSVRDVIQHRAEELVYSEETDHESDIEDIQGGTNKYLLAMHICSQIKADELEGRIIQQDKDAVKFATESAKKDARITKLEAEVSRLRHQAASLEESRASVQLEETPRRNRRTSKNGSRKRKILH